ncbi:DUF4306 domain-containing protein [Bacillus licheniformis]|nr:DUF4306 domain-containing protein [Bacillus licheniformis]
MKFVLYAVQFGTAALLFLFSALASWYQGSELLKVPWEFMNRARKLVLFEEDEHAAPAFKMDRNGNLEKMAE